MPLRAAKIKLPKDRDFVSHPSFPVKRYHIDTNHHVNNSYYPLMAWEYLPEDFCCRRLQVEYKKAAVLGDQIYPAVLEEEGKFLVVLADENQNPYAIIKAE